MFIKAILTLMFVVSILSSGSLRVSGQVPQPGQQPNSNMRETPLPKLKFPGGKSVVEVPFEVEGNWMVIPISINNSRPLRFVLDTGAQGTFLQNSQLADSLNLKIVGKMQIRGAGGGGAVREASVAENVTYNIGGIELSNGGLVVAPSPSDARFAPKHDGA
ncbi:MAG: aspartyl protease family protein, partial [Acidobacteria bacterium]|nr:aspartyl protease family protein [Acidobacteriota bacterium]